MKKAYFLIFGLGCIGAVTLLASSTRIQAKTWRNVETHDVRELSKNLKSYTRQFVAVKFNFRGKDIHHLKPTWYESSIWQRDPQGKKGFSNVRVMIAKKDLPAFKAITTDASSSTEMTAYGRVLWDSESKFTFVQLLGRNATVDSSGNTVLSW
jgi:hypothetical protein